MGFPDDAVIKNLPANAGDARNMGLIPGSGRSPEEGMATHSSILAWRDRAAWWATVDGVAKSQIQLSNLHFLFLSLRQLYDFILHFGNVDGVVILICRY